MLLELWSGLFFFPSRDIYGQLAMMEKAVGKIPKDMVEN